MPVRELHEQTAQVEVQMHAGDGLQMQASGQVPLNRDAPIALKLSGSFNLNLINPIIEASGQRVLGREDRRRTGRHAGGAAGARHAGADAAGICRITRAART